MNGLCNKKLKRMKNVFHIVVFVVLLLASNSSFAIEVTYPASYRTTSALNIRQKPNRNSTVMGLLPQYRKVVVDSLHNERWACITHNGNVAYISTDYIRCIDWEKRAIAVWKLCVTNGKEIITLVEEYFPRITKWLGFHSNNVWAWILDFFFIFVCVSFVRLLSSDSLRLYVPLIVLCLIGTYFLGEKYGNGKVCAVIACVFLGLRLWVAFKQRRLRFELGNLSNPIYTLNQLQYFLQKPWRNLQKHQNNRLCRILQIPPKIYPAQHKMQRFSYRMWGVGHVLISAVFFVLQFSLYVLCAPLRFVNAVIYNIFIHIPCALHDYVAEVFYPMGEGMRNLNKWEYLWQYFKKLPYRFGKFLLKRGIFTILESVIYTLVDIVVPTLTMYHGTSYTASHKITGGNKVEFIVGRGNYAGNGIYFGISKDTTAYHYQKGAIIVARVSLGRVMNVNITPDDVRKNVKYNGNYLTIWGLQRKVRTNEWWRDKCWWEYCMLQSSGVYRDSWRIRPLYVINVRTGFKERIYKGMAHWLFK